MGIEDLVIEKVKVEKLKPAKYNPRKDLKPGDEEYEKIKRSIETFGYVDPVIWNKTTGNVVGGHQRLKILLEKGVKEISCVVVELSSVKEKELNISLNKNTGLWDYEKLADLFVDINLEGGDLTETGFGPTEIGELLNGTIQNGTKEDDFNVEEELEKPTITKAGDLWLLGPHRVYCGDSTKAESYEILMAGKKANLILTDPPYNVDYEGTAGKIKNDNMADEDFYKFLLAAFTNGAEALANDGSSYVFHADTEGLNFRRAFSDAGFYQSGTCIWDKGSLVLGRSPYQWQHEPVLFGWKKKGKHLWYGGRKQTTIWKHEKPKRNGEHPTMKPIGLLAIPLSNSTQTNSIVLDMFGGSGSTLIACEQLGRVGYLIELDEKFVDVIVKRYIEQVGSADKVHVIRDGKECKYTEVAPAEQPGVEPFPAPY